MLCKFGEDIVGSKFSLSDDFDILRVIEFAMILNKLHVDFFFSFCPICDTVFIA